VSSSSLRLYLSALLEVEELWVLSLNPVPLWCGRSVSRGSVEVAAMSDDRRPGRMVRVVSE